MTDQDLQALAKAAEAARLAKGWSKERAAREADVSSITYKRVEDGQRVQDAKLAAITRALGLDSTDGAGGPVPVGAPADGGPHNDDHDDGLGQWLTRTKSELTDAEQEQMWRDAEPVLEALLERTLAKRRRGSTLGDT